jgi:hypothetical protein
MKKSILVLALVSTVVAHAQNVGINATGAAPVSSAALDVDMANKGVLIPRVALTTATAFAPVTGTATTSLLVYNTATAGLAPNNVVPGYYYWDNTLLRWLRIMVGGVNDYWITGASAATVNNPVSTGFLGTSNNNHVDLVTNGIVRGRLSNLGEFFIGTTATALAGDLMNGVSNATFPWAINGYSSFNGSGVYGSIQAGTTIFAGVQGEYSGTATTGAGVRGIYIATTAGTAFNAAPCGVNGTATAAGAYKFGVFGSGGTTQRSGGVMGYDYGIGVGGLGYFSSGSLDYSVYGFGLAFTTGAAAGKAASGTKSTTALPEVNTNVGLGIYGGMMGGWIRGLAYGTHVKGEIYSMYVDGKTYTNAPITQLVSTEGDRQPVYASSAMKVEISDRGKSTLANGQKYIAFSDAFKNVVSSNPEELTITVTPMGNSNGMYIASYDQNGFTVVENNNGASNVTFTWIAIGTRKEYESMDHDAQLLSNDFDQKMDGVMFNDNNNSATPQTMWWNGTQMVFDQPVPAKESLPGFVPAVDASRKAGPAAVAPATVIED